MTPKEILKEVATRTYNFVYKDDLGLTERRTAGVLVGEGVLKIEKDEFGEMYTINKKYFEK